MKTRSVETHLARRRSVDGAVAGTQVVQMCGVAIQCSFKHPPSGFLVAGRVGFAFAVVGNVAELNDGLQLSSCGWRQKIFAVSMNCCTSKHASNN